MPRNKYSDASERVAGRHYISNWGMSTQKGTRRVVAFHEKMHDDILASTSYGALQRLFYETHVKEDSTNLSLLKSRWLNALHRNSQFAHESFATYLSIKLLPSPDIDNELNNLTDEYLTYFNTLSSVIDKLFSSTFVQFIVARIFSAIAFQSPLGYRLADEGLDYNVRIHPMEAPDYRLNHILNYFMKSNNANELIDAVKLIVTNEYSEPFDFQKEADWLRLNENTRFKIEEQLMARIPIWFHNINYCGLDVFNLANLNNVLLKISGKLIALGASFSLINPDLYRRLFGVETDLILSFEKFRYGDVENENSLRAQAPSRYFHNKKEFYWMLDDKDPKHRTVAIQCKPIAEIPAHDGWYVVLLSKDKETSVVRISHDILLRFIKTRLSGKDLNGPFYDNLTWVMGLLPPAWENSQKTFYSSIESAIDMFDLSSHQKQKDSVSGYSSHTHPGVDRIVFYMHSNFFLWLDIFSSFKNPRYDYVGYTDQPPSEIVDRKYITGIGLHILRCDDFPMPFIKIQPYFAFQHVLKSVAEYSQTTGKISVNVSKKEEQYNQFLLDDTVVAIQAVWSYF